MKSQAKNFYSHKEITALNSFFKKKKRAMSRFKEEVKRELGSLGP